MKLRRRRFTAEALDDIRYEGALMAKDMRAGLMAMPHDLQYHPMGFEMQCVADLQLGLMALNFLEPMTREAVEARVKGNTET